MRTKFLLPFVAALTLTGCSDDKTAPDVGGGSTTGDHFLAVNVISHGSSDTRADYENGDATENTVKDVRIYFFSSTGDVVNIKKKGDEYINYYDIPTDQIKPNDPDKNPGESVENILQAVVIVEKGEQLPAQILAVINPDIKNLGDKSLSLSYLQDLYNDYAAKANATTPQFIMTNSVYSDANGIITATHVAPGNYATTADAAKQNPVEIYVERNVAKVRLSANGLSSDVQKSNDGKTTMYKLYKAIKNDKGTITGSEDLTIDNRITDEKGNVTIQKKNVYLRLDGWSVTADVAYEYFLKKIKDTWSSDYLGSDLKWNEPNKHRSYWADVCNPDDNKNKNNYFAYNATDKYKKDFSNTAIYCNENAERPGEAGLQPTKIIVNGTICDADGKPVVITEYGGTRFVDNDSLDNLKNRYIQMMKGMKAELPWRKVTKDGKETYVQLSADELTMKAVEYINPADFPEGKAAVKKEGSRTYDVNTGRYYVYPRLTDIAAGYTWFSMVREDPEKPGTYIETATTAEAINKELLQLSHAKVWRNGKTYYYADIKHLGNNNKYGVVRNHIYDISLTKIYGIGTPVYSEELPIIPEKPQDDDTYIAARINVLQWRVVNNNVIFEWD